MKKRGQVTLFIIIGIIFLLVIGVVVYYKDSISEIAGLTGSLSYPSEMSEIVEHVQDCVDDSADEAVSNIGLSGGYYTLPDESVDGIPYYYYEGESLMISLEEMESELDDYIGFLLSSCIDLEVFTGFDELNGGELAVASTVNENSVDVVVEYPIDVAVDDSVYDLDEDYLVVLDANLGWLHSVAENIVEYDIENPEEVSLDFLLDQGLENIIYVPYDDETTVYILEDTTSFNGEKNLTLLFASYFPVSEEHSDMSIEDYWESLL